MKPETKFGLSLRLQTWRFDGESSLTNIKNKNNIKLTRLVRFLFQVINVSSSEEVIYEKNSLHCNKHLGLVAQWLEHTLDKRGVASSTLARPTIHKDLCKDE